MTGIGRIDDSALDESSQQELVANATIVADSIEALDRNELTARLDDCGLLVVRGLVSVDEILTAKAKIRDQFSPANDHAARGETPEQLYANFQKLAIYGSGFRPNAHAQCVRTFFNPIFADDVYGMREAFRRTARLRNLLSDVPLDWAVDGIDDGFWTAARMHHYPAGAGFMDTHQEIQVPKIYEEAGLSIAYYQPLIVMSRRGNGADCDFETGGGFFMQGEKKIFFEQYCNIGDVLVYDTRMFHGVSEIDPHLEFRQDSLAGRFAAFVTLYKDLSGARAA